MNVDGTLAMDPSERCCMCHVILSYQELDPLSLCSECQLLSVRPAQDVQITGSTRHTRYNTSPMDMDGTLAADSSERCCMCHIILSPDELDPLNFCWSCNLLYTQPIQDIQRTRSIRQTRYDTSQESIEIMWSQQFTDMIEHENQSVDTEQRSRQWNRVLSDTESDSDASVDIDSFLDDDESDAHPYNGHLNQLYSDDDDEFEEVENTGGNLVDRVRLHSSLATNGQNFPVDWLSEILSPETAAGIRTSDRRRLFDNLENQETSRYARNGGDYVDSREFNEVMELLAETDSLRRGPPPAAVSFVKNLEGMVVDEEFICVICKDNVCVGSVVNRLPCGHVYHPSCIKPWLNARNTCPLCRYELPTDDKDCGKRRNQETEEYASSEEDYDDGEGNNESVGRGRW